MTIQPNRPSRSDAVDKLSKELLEAITQDETVYPWNPTDPESEAYFAELEQDFSITDCFSSEEIETQSETFFSRLHQHWETTESTQVEAALLEQFSDVPLSWLETIARKAKQMVKTNLTELQQLVECVKPLLSNWAEEDLLGLARLASAVQGNQVRLAPWEELTPLEQACLSLAIAQYALTQLEDF